MDVSNGEPIERSHSERISNPTGFSIGDHNLNILYGDDAVLIAEKK